MQLEILRTIQRMANPALDILMECVTVFGEAAVIMLAFCAVYWCFDKQLGRYLAASLCASVCLNGVVKDFVKAPRPIGEAGIISHRVETATGYSFPSGHTQNITAFCAALFLAVKQNWLRVLCAVLPLLVGFSRLYLGVHYPADVLGGLVLGALVSLLLHDLMIRRGNVRSAWLFLAVMGTAALAFGEQADTLKAAGTLWGALGGFLLEEKSARFSAEGLSAKARAFRFLGGAALVGILYAVPKLLLPDLDWIAGLRYALVAFAATGGWPCIFVRLRL